MAAQLWQRRWKTDQTRQTSLLMQSRMGEEALVVRVRVLTGQS